MSTHGSRLLHAPAPAPMSRYIVPSSGSVANAHLVKRLAIKLSPVYVHTYTRFINVTSRLVAVTIELVTHSAHICPRARDGRTVFRDRYFRAQMREILHGFWLSTGARAELQTEIKFRWNFNCIAISLGKFVDKRLEISKWFYILKEFLKFDNFIIAIIVTRSKKEIIN